MKLVLVKLQVKKVVEPVRDFLAVFFFASLGESKSGVCVCVSDCEYCLDVLTSDNKL